jgi:hypothetical protein
MNKPPFMQAIIFLLFIAFSGACSKEYSASGYKPPTNPQDSFNLTINFKPVVDSVPLSFDSAYTNFWKEPYTVSLFKFYVSKFDLINTDSNRVYHVNVDKYFLIDAADSNTWSVHLLATPFTYNRISFLIGVDSIRNVSGAQTGALDPINGMFWTWNSGYVMAKLEGNSPLSSLANNKIEYHIGGFMGPDNVLIKPTLLFPFGKYSIVQAGKKNAINVNADVNAWFFNPHQLKIKNNPACTTPGALAKDHAENYSKMFVVTSIVNN